MQLFNAEHFHAEEIVELVKMSGARYIVPFSKHHDGFCLWDSDYSMRDAADMYPGRDLTAELVEACRKEGIPHGFYFSVEEYEYPLIGRNDSLMIRYWSEEIAPDTARTRNRDGEVMGAFHSDLHNRMLWGKIPVKDFINQMIVPPVSYTHLTLPTNREV